MNTPRYKRGDKHPSSAGLFFLRYLRGEDVWVTQSTLDINKIIPFKAA